MAASFRTLESKASSPPLRDRLALRRERRCDPLRRRRGRLHRHGRGAGRDLQRRPSDDGYAVLEVRDEAGEGFALVGPVAHLNEGDRAEVSGDWQTHSRYGRQLKARGALPLDPADRAGRIAYLTSLRHIGPARAERLVDEHGEGVLGAIGADPEGVFAALQRGQRGAGRRRGRVLARLARDPRPARAAGAARAGAPGGADPRPLRRALDGGPARGPLPADRGRRGRLRPRRQDRARRRRAARVRAARPGGGGLRPRRGRAAGQHLPAGRGAEPAHGEADRPASRPRRAGAGARPDDRRGPRLPRADVCERGRGRGDAGRARRGAAAPRTRARRAAAGGRRGGAPAHRRAVGGRARRLRGADLRADRRARRRQDRLHAGDRRRGGAGRRRGRALRADRAGGAAARGGDRARGADDPPAARVDAGARAGLPAGRTRCRPAWRSSTRPRCSTCG